MDKQNFVVGQVILVQLGNPTDVNYHGVKECCVIKTRDVRVRDTS